MNNDNQLNSDNASTESQPMQYPSICRNPNISKDAIFLIDSGLCPSFLGRDSELYSLEYIIEAIDGKNFVFSSDDEKAFRDMAKKADYVEMSVGGMRDFAMVSK